MKINDYRNQILIGNNKEVLKGLPDNSVHCFITSPPYFGLRNYETDPQIFGGDDNCEHDFTLIIKQHPNGNGGQSEKRSIKGERNFSASTDYNDRTLKSNYCHKCGAWKGELGLEPTIEMYIDHLVEIFAEVYRVLREDGTFWLNIADTYWGSGSPGGDFRDGKGGDDYLRSYNRSGKKGVLKPKDLCLVPQRLAIALQEYGWYVRSEVIWNKIAGMPESVTDRPTRDHEQVWLLTKSAKYFFDNESIKETSKSSFSDLKKMIESKDRIGGKTLNAEDPLYKANKETNIGKKRSVGEFGKRNKRTVWSIASQPFKEAHFATFPPNLIAPMILAGTSDHGVCANCHKPYKPIIEKIRLTDMVDNPDKRFRRRESEHQITPINQPNRSSTDVIRGSSETKFDKDKNSAGRLATYRQGAREYASKYKQYAYGQELTAFQREETITKERDAARVIAEELFPDDKHQQQKFINYIHDHGQAAFSKIVGWEKQCKCQTDQTVNAIVCDPFFGSGTTGLVALRAGRDFIGIELNPKFAKLAENRLSPLLDQYKLL